MNFPLPWTTLSFLTAWNTVNFSRTVQKMLGPISCSQHTQAVSLTPHPSATSNISVSELPASSLCLVSSCPLLALHSSDSPWSPQSCHMSIAHPCVAPTERWPLGIALPCSPGTADLQNKVHHLELDIFLFEVQTWSFVRSVIPNYLMKLLQTVN
jgi:hypothetical protein